MNILAVYKRTIKGFGCYETTIDGQVCATGGLPDRIEGQRVLWTLIPATANYVGRFTQGIFANRAQ